MGPLVGGLLLYFFCFFDFFRKVLLLTSNVKPSCSDLSSPLASGGQLLSQNPTVVPLGLGRRIGRDGGNSSILEVVHFTESYQLSCASPGKLEEVNRTLFSPVISCRGVSRST